MSNWRRGTVMAAAFAAALALVATPLAAAEGAIQVDGTGGIHAISDGVSPAFTEECPEPAGYAEFGDITLELTGISPEGRIAPFGGTVDVCDTQVVGTWFFAFGPDKDVADLYEVVSYALDGAELDLTQTAPKPIPTGPDKGVWWFAAGDPVLGMLAPGSHDIVLDVTVVGTPLSFTTTVDVDAAHC